MNLTQGHLRQHRFPIPAERLRPQADAQSAGLFLQADPTKYGQAVQWIHKLLYRTKLTTERAKVLANKMKNHQLSNMIKQKTFLKAILKRLECLPNEVIKDLEELCFLVTKPSNMLVHMAADLSSLSSPLA